MNRATLRTRLLNGSWAIACDVVVSMPRRMAKAIRPWAVIAGVVVAFVSCCVAGKVLSRTDCYPQFTRFHYYVSPQTLYYPTASQVRRIPRARPGQEKIIVVVGGNSVFVGVSQGREHFWTKKLAEELGDDYEVINLAMPGAYPLEFGGTAAEFLAEDHPRLIFISYAPCIAGLPWPSDGQQFTYFLWDAYYKGMLPHDATREKLLRELKKEHESDQPFWELQQRSRLDSVLYFEDMWTTMTYRHISTVWAPGLVMPFTRPRQCYSDPDPGSPPMGKRYPAEQEARCMAFIRDCLLRSAPDTLARAAQLRNGLPGIVFPLESSLDNLPLKLHRQTLLLLVHDSPHYINQLTPGEQATYAELFSAAAVIVQTRDVSTLEIGKHYTSADFVDRCHLSTEGGVKMALDVAPAVRRLASQLGYTPSPTSPRETAPKKARADSRTSRALQAP